MCHRGSKAEGENQAAKSRNRGQSCELQRAACSFQLSQQPVEVTSRQGRHARSVLLVLWPQGMDGTKRVQKGETGCLLHMPCAVVQQWSAARCASAWHLTGAASWAGPCCRAAQPPPSMPKVGAQRGCAGGRARHRS